MSLSLLSPLWLALAALLPLTVLLYVLKVRREPRQVGSLFLWRQALEETDAQVPFRRLRRHWLLLLQLLILALLALAAARPVRRVEAVPVGEAVLILDASASMKADGRAGAAREAARRVISGKRRGDRWTVLRAGATPRVLCPATDATSDLLSGLDEFRPAASPLDGPAAVELARSIAGESATIVWIGDDPTSLGEAADDVRFVPVGASVENVGIIRMSVRPTDLSGRDYEAFVALRNASASGRSGRLEVRLDDRIVAAENLELPAEGTVERAVPLIGVKEGVVTVTWRGERDDALPDDDQASWHLRPRGERRYRVVGTATPALAHALGALPGWRAALG